MTHIWCTYEAFLITFLQKHDVGALYLLVFTSVGSK